MSELKPLLDSEMPEDLSRVLRSAEADGPLQGDPAAARTLAAVAAHRAAIANAGERARAGIPFAKVMLVLVFAGAGSATLLATFGSSAPRGAKPALAFSPSMLAEAPPAPPLSPPQGVRVDDLPTARVEYVASKDTAPPPVRRADSAVELEDELALIDAARAALAAKRPEAALARVSTYHRRFRTGHFTEEAEALEIQALVAMGRRDEAKAKGQRFLASHPGSAYERRVQSALASEVTP